MRTLPRPATKAEWLDARRPYVGASDAATLMDRNPFDRLPDLAVRKIKGLDVPETKAMRRGNTLEYGVAVMWMEEHGINVVPASVLYVNGPFMATPDFEPVDFEADWLLEVKTISAYVDELPEHWKIQGYVQAYCSGRTSIEFAVLDKTLTCKPFTLDCTTDEARLCIDTLVPAAERFLAYVAEGKVPEGLELSEWAVKALFPRAEQKAVQVDASVLQWISELADAREIKNAAKKREDAAKDALAAVLVDAECARYGNSTVLTWKNSKDGLAFNRDLFEAEHPGVLELMESERYKRPVPGARTMRPTKEGTAAAADMPWARADQEAF